MSPNNRFKQKSALSDKFGSQADGASARPALQGQQGHDKGAAKPTDEAIVVATPPEARPRRNYPRVLGSRAERAELRQCRAAARASVPPPGPGASAGSVLAPAHAQPCNQIAPCKFEGGILIEALILPPKDLSLWEHACRIAERTDGRIDGESVAALAAFKYFDYNRKGRSALWTTDLRSMGIVNPQPRIIPRSNLVSG